MKELLVGLVLVAVGGLVTAALKYPLGYRRICTGLNVAMGIATIGFVAYFIGYLDGATLLYPFIENDKFDQAMAAVDATKPDPRWPLAGLPVAALLLFLFFIRQILGLPDNDDVKGDDKDEEHPDA